MLHRLTECGVGQEIGEWTCTRIARIRRTDPRRVPTEWLFRPCFQIWRPQRHQAILWILANMVFQLVHRSRILSVMDCTDFMRRKRWNTYQYANRMKLVGNYLEVL